MAPPPNRVSCQRPLHRRTHGQYHPSVPSRLYLRCPKQKFEQDRHHSFVTGCVMTLFEKTLKMKCIDYPYALLHHAILSLFILLIPVYRPLKTKRFTIRTTQSVLYEFKLVLKLWFQQSATIKQTGHNASSAYPPVFQSFDGLNCHIKRAWSCTIYTNS